MRKTGDSMLKKIIALLLVALLANETNVYSKEDKYIPLSNKELKSIVPSTTRKVFSLNDKWKMRYSEGDDEKNISLPYSDPNNKRMILEKKFKLPQGDINKYSWQLYFLGIDDEVEVYFNNEYVKKEFGGMIPFTLDIDANLVTKQTNVIKLIVSPAETGAGLIKQSAVFNKKVYTGVIREALLIATPKIWINSVKYSTKKDPETNAYDLKSIVDISSGKIVQIFGGTEGKDTIGVLSKNKTAVTIESYIRNLQTGNIVTRGKSQKLTISGKRTKPLKFEYNKLRAHEWAPDKPVLYELTYRIMKSGQLIDDYSIEIAFTDIQIGKEDNNPILFVNGHPRKIKGVDYIEDYYGAGQTISADKIKEDVESIKTLGANLVRCKFSVPHPYFIHLCNEYGLFVLIELPLYHTPKTILTSDEIKVRMENTAKMIVNAYSHCPSVLGWGISEGSQEGIPEIDQMAKSLISFFDSTSTKLIYKNVLFGSETIYHEGYDLIGISDHNKFRTPEEIKGEMLRLKAAAGQKPVFANFGTPIELNNHNGYSDPRSIESQAYYITNLFDFVNSNGFAGSLIWSYNDYSLQNPLMIINNDDKYLCTSGIVDRERKHRLSYRTLQALFNEEKEPLLDAGKYSESTPLSFIIVGIILSLIIVFLINRYRRFREYLTRAVLRPYNFYADIRDQRIMSSLQTILLGLGISVTISLFISSIFYAYRSNELTQYVFMMFVPSNGLRETLFDLVWMPQLSILLLTLLFFASIFIVAGIIRLFSFFVRARIFYADTITIVVWAGVPIFILLPLAIILSRLLLVTPFFVYMSLFLLIVIAVWLLMRILRSTSVVFDVPSLRVYIIGLLFVGIIKTVMLTFYNHDYSFFSYFQYYWEVMLHI